jgi:hypothetical protein
MSLNCVYFFPKQEQKNKKTYKKAYKSQLIEKNIYSNNYIYITNKLYNQVATNYRNHFIIPSSVNNVNSSKIYDNTENIKDNLQTNYYLFNYEKQELIYFKYYLKKLDNSQKYIYSLIHFFKYLLYSIKILIDNNIIHNNIELDNILIDDFDNPLLSDLQYSIIKETDTQIFGENIKHYLTKYEINKSPELVIVSYMLTNKLKSLSLYNIETIIEDIIENNKLIHNFGNEFVSNYKNNGLNYFQKYVNKSYEYIIEDILQYSHTWDNYSLSLIYLKICVDIHRHINISNKFIILFINLLVQNISIEPNKRLSIEETTNKFIELLYNIDENQFNQLLIML